MNMFDTNGDVVELFHSDLRMTIRTSIVPIAGSIISIRGVDWTVAKVYYAVDYADKPECRMRAICDLVKTPLSRCRSPK